MASIFIEECIPLTLEELDWLADSVALFGVLATKIGISAPHAINALLIAIYVTAATCAVSQIRRSNLWGCSKTLRSACMHR
jgi:hypothetical protein